MRPARFVVPTPSPTYPPAQARPDTRSSPTELYQSRGMPMGPPHVWDTLTAPICGKRLADDALEGLEHAGLVDEVVV